MSGSRRPAPARADGGRALDGTSVAWRPRLASLLAELCETGRLHFTEVVAENLDPDGLPEPLLRLRGHGVVVVPHGVSLGLAAADLPDTERLDRLGLLAERLDAPLVSEHVAFVRAAATSDPLHGEVLEAGHLLPPPRTREALAITCENIRRAQDSLPVPLAVENIAALLSWPEDEMSEPDFLTELTERTGVGLVLDVANLVASATARGSDPVADLRRFPLERVAYVHVAGGIVRDGLYLDTHAHAVRSEVTALLASYVERLDESGLPGILLERDADLDPDAVRADLTAIEDALTGARPSTSPRSPR